MVELCELCSSASTSNVSNGSFFLSSFSSLQNMNCMRLINNQINSTIIHLCSNGRRTKGRKKRRIYQFNKIGKSSMFQRFRSMFILCNDIESPSLSLSLNLYAYLALIKVHLNDRTNVHNCYFSIISLQNSNKLETCIYLGKCMDFQPTCVRWWISSIYSLKTPWLCAFDNKFIKCSNFVLGIKWNEKNKWMRK